MFAAFLTRKEEESEAFFVEESWLIIEILFYSRLKSSRCLSESWLFYPELKAAGKQHTIDNTP
jgi:hypothetical protein